MNRVWEIMNKIICGDALDVLRTLPAKCCRCCVTSPPYFNLRDYGVHGQLGLEPTMQEYIIRLVEVFTEVKRVLTDDGTLWVNIADGYAGSGKAKSSLPAKNLMLIPQRFVIAMQDAGWIVRDEVVWAKPNPMPESVRDRMTASTEKIFMFTKRPKYFFDSTAAIEPAVGFNNEPVAGSLGNLGNAQQEIKNQGWKYTELPLAVTITAYMSVPTSKSKKFKQAAILGRERPAKKPDTDNIFKCITDALSGIAYKDDKQIVAATVNKWYAEVPRVEALIRII